MNQQEIPHLQDTTENGKIIRSFKIYCINMNPIKSSQSA